jgi:mannose-6-phosphate isomerase-like protein (cupin superfamily)
MSEGPRNPPASSYRQWLLAEGLDVIPGNYVPDLRLVGLRPWARTGGAACFINHDGSDTSNDCYISEVPPGGSLLPQRHLHEAMFYVLHGRGSSTVWDPSGHEHFFEWQEGSLFAIPMNAPYRHHNGSGDDVVRLLAVTNAPTLINLFADADFIFNCEYHFPRRFSGARGYFSGQGSLDGRIWATNFVPDVRGFKLIDYKERGAGTNIHLKLAGNTMGAHISEFPVGTYKKAHRHGPGAHVIILDGTGYTLMWREGEEMQRFDWSVDSLVIPPDMMFHQHFNTGSTPARYLALRHTESKARDGATGLPMSSISTRNGGDQIDHEDENPRVREMYRLECEKHGVEFRMDEHR